MRSERAPPVKVRMALALNITKYHFCCQEVPASVMRLFCNASGVLFWLHFYSFLLLRPGVKKDTGVFAYIDEYSTFILTRRALRGLDSRER